MKLILSDEQSLLQNSIHSFAKRLAESHCLRTLPDLPARFPACDFEEAAAGGWLSLMVGEDKGGAGLGLTELCLVAEELGSALSPLPLVPAIAGIVALADCDTTLPPEVLSNALAGKTLIIPAFQNDAFGAMNPLRAIGDRSQALRVSGRRVAVPSASAATGFITDVAIGEDVALIYLPSDLAGLQVVEKIAVDGTVLGEIRLEEAQLSSAYVLAVGLGAYRLKQKIEIVLKLGLAAELLGLMSAAVRRTLDYLKTRVQFGRPIGSFQALQHRAVNDHIQVEVTRSLLYETAKPREIGDDLDALASAAKAKAGAAALAVIASGIQMHGAIGFTDEYDIGLMLKRAMTLEASYGPAGMHRRRYRAHFNERLNFALPTFRRPSDEDTFFRAEVRDWIEITLPADLRHLPTRPAFSQAMWWHRQLYHRGWIAPNWPKEHGGMEASLQQQLILEEELGRAGAPEISRQAIDHVGPILIAFGSDAQKSQHLTGMLAGSVAWCQGYSEPGAGSDLASLKTSATPDGDYFIVNGQKIWTTWAHYADWMFALVRTEAAARKKQEGISFLLIDMKTPGVTARPIKTIAGQDELAQVFLDNVKVPRENIVGAVNDGWRIANALLANERLHSSSPQKCIAVLQQVGSAAAAGAIDDPVFVDRLVGAQIEVLALAAAYEHAVAATRAGHHLGAEVSFIRLASAELVQKLSALLVEACGSDGALQSALDEQGGALHAAATYLQSRRSTIYTGTAEIQRNIIAKRVLELP